MQREGHTLLVLSCRPLIRPHTELSSAGLTSCQAQGCMGPGCRDQAAACHPQTSLAADGGELGQQLKESPPRPYGP